MKPLVNASMSFVKPVADELQSDAAIGFFDTRFGVNVPLPTEPDCSV